MYELKSSLSRHTIVGWLVYIMCAWKHSAHVFMYVCRYLCVCIMSMHEYVYHFEPGNILRTYLCMYVWVYMYVYVCMYECICMYEYVCMCTCMRMYAWGMYVYMTRFSNQIIIRSTCGKNTDFIDLCALTMCVNTCGKNREIPTNIFVGNKDGTLCS